MLKNKLKLVKLSFPKEFGFEYIVFNLYNIRTIIKIYDKNDNAFKYRIIMLDGSTTDTLWINRVSHIETQERIDNLIGSICNES